MLKPTLKHSETAAMVTKHARQESHGAQQTRQEFPAFQAFQRRQNSMSLHSSQDGYILVITLVVLLVLTILGLSTTNRSKFELLISGNDRVHKETFYLAEQGTEIGSRLAYDNAICIQVNNGFNANVQDEGGATLPKRSFGKFLIEDLDFANPGTLASTLVSDTNRAVAYYPESVQDDTTPHTNLLFESQLSHTPGSGLQMVSGYEGLGASSAGGGSQLNYSIYSLHNGIRNSRSQITLGWQLSTHLLNNAAQTDCNTVYTQ